MITGKTIVVASASLLLSTITIAQEAESAKPVAVPVRVGIVPGLSTQGAADKYTTSHFSFNLWGGITGSVNGAELGGLFNIDKGNVQYVQVAGLFNMVNGTVRGVQMAGWFNKTDGQVTGAQAGCFGNITNKHTRGAQAAGWYNHAGEGIAGAQAAGIGNFSGSNTKGVQSAGIANISGGNMQGVQLAGIANISNGNLQGVQIAGIVNIARRVKGLQIGLINIADTSQGFSFGLINIVRKGYYKLELSANEVMHVNLAVKTGNPKLYNILLAGVNPGSDNKVFSFGWGVGRHIPVGKILSLNPELTAQYLYLGDWDSDNYLTKLQLLVNLRIAKGFALSAGPSFAVYYSNQDEPVKGYKFRIPEGGYHQFELWNNNLTGWIGWQAGITLF